MKTLPRIAVGLVIAVWTVGARAPVFAQEQEPVPEGPATQQALAMTYPEGRTISVKLEGTYRLPRASGEAKVERKKGITEIEVELDEMKPASFFGGDYRTYVLWTLSPEGQAKNTGEFVLDGNRSKLNISTPLQTLAMVVTAEPHFLVERPSRFVVLENMRPVQTAAPMTVAEIPYRGFQGIYNAERETLAQMPEAKGEVRTDLAQAFIAVELAERAGAVEHAPEELARASDALQNAQKAAESSPGGSIARNLARDAVRLAVEAQEVAKERAFEAALEAERKARANQIDTLQQAIAEAETQAERARLEAEQRELQLRMEERARQEAQQEAEEAAQRAAAEAAAKEEARARLQEALGYVAETRQTARGLIVNLPDILFDFDKAVLRPGARELVSRIAGILLVTPGIRLSIEGHTDSVGTEEYNQQLSQKRAQSVHDYLAEAGVPADIMTTHGFGETQPIAPNTTPSGRQQNRRVEIVITETEQFARP